MEMEKYSLKELKKIEEKLDDINGEHGIPEQLCIFCGACTAISERGIVHSPSCIIEQLRSAIYIRESEEE